MTDNAPWSTEYQYNAWENSLNVVANIVKFGESSPPPPQPFKKHIFRDIRKTITEQEVTLQDFYSKRGQIAS